MSEALKSGMACTSAYLLAVVILITPALLNGFPFVLDDTMDYVALNAVLYRSTFYSLFVNATDLQISPWLPALAQAFIITHLVSLWLRVAVPGASLFLLPLLTLCLTLISSLAFVASYLMPDIFTSVLLLSTALLLFAREKVSRGERWYLVFLTGLSVSVHLSHIPILGITLVAIAIALLLRGERLSHIIKRIAPVAVPASMAALLMFVGNIVLFGIAKLSPAGPIFLLASLIANGPASDYLKDACPDARYRICAEVDALPIDSNSFLWGGMLYKLGWFEDYRGEAETIVSETIKSRPLDVAHMAMRSFATALLSHAPAEDFRPLGWNMWRVEGALAKYGPETVERFRNSAQVRDALPKPLIKAIDRVMLPLTLLALMVFALKLSRREPDLTWMIFAVLTGALANIFVCAVFSGVFDRYQTRVTWLIPLLALTLALRLMREALGSKLPIHASHAA